MSKKDNELTFRLIKNNDIASLFFSDGNVIAADKDGITAYSMTKTVTFEGKTTKTNSTFIEAWDEKVRVWILPIEKKESLGLQNDIVIGNGEILRKYYIPKKYFTKIKDFMYQKSIEKFQ